MLELPESESVPDHAYVYEPVPPEAVADQVIGLLV